MAEVKVKITAANQTQTGFQSVLADAQKTATQVQQTFARAADPGIRMFKPKDLSSGEPIKIDIGDYGLEPLRELQERVRALRESARQSFDPEPTEEFNGGIAGVLGRFALLIGAAATVGKVVALAFDQLSNAVKSAIGVQEQFNKTLEQAGQATSLEGAISEFGRLRASAEQTGKIVQETFGRSVGESIANALSARPGQLLARAADFFSGGAVSAELKAQQEQQRRIALDTTRGNLARLALEEDERAATGGDPKALEKLEREQRKRRELEALRASIQNESPQNQAVFEAELKALQAQRDQNEAARERFQTEQEVTKEKEKQAAASAREAEQAAKRAAAEQQKVAAAQRNATASAQAQAQANRVATMTPQERLDFEMQGLADLEGFAGPEVDLQRQQAIGRILSLQQQLQGQGEGGMVGSFGASSLQRIGFASNEFFDTRRKEDPTKETKRAADTAKQILEILKKGEPLVLPSNS